MDPLQPSLLPPMVAFIGPQAKAILVPSYFEISVPFHLSITINLDQADQSCILHDPDTNGIKESRKPHFTSPSAYCIYLHQHLLPLTITIPPVQGPEKDFCQSSDHCRIAIKRESPPPTIAKYKRTPATDSLADLQGLEKTFLSNHVRGLIT
jgi:hypothetical protein